MKLRKLIKYSRRLGIPVEDLLAMQDLHRSRGEMHSSERGWVDPRPWPRRHPMLALVGGLVLGVVALSLVMTIVGMLVALAVVGIKVAIVVAIAYYILRMLKGRRRHDPGSAIVPFEQRRGNNW